MHTALLSLLLAGSPVALAETPTDAQLLVQAPQPALTPRPFLSFSQPEEQWRQQVFLSSVWAFTSLNYLYCDLIDFMDTDMHEGYHSGEIEGLEFTPGFLAGATGIMQVPLGMVFLSTALPPRASRIANITAGVWTTGIQTASLFVGKPSPHYAVSSAVEISATAFITGYAIFAMKPRAVEPTVSLTPEGATVGLRVPLR